MLTLDQAHAIMHAAIEEAGRRNLKPLAVLVLDAGPAQVSALAKDVTEYLATLAFPAPVNPTGLTLASGGALSGVSSPSLARTRRRSGL